MIDNVGGGAGIFKTKYKNAAEEKNQEMIHYKNWYFGCKPVYNAPILSGEIQEPV